MPRLDRGGLVLVALLAAILPESSDAFYPAHVIRTVRTGAALGRGGVQVASSTGSNDEDAYYGGAQNEGLRKRGPVGGAKKPHTRRPPPRRSDSRPGDAAQAGPDGNFRPQRQQPARSGEAPVGDWKAAVDLNQLGKAGQGGQGGQGGGYKRNGGGGGNYQGGQRRGGGGGRGRQSSGARKSWWMSDSYTQMDGELVIPPAWWAEPFTQDPHDMKVPELKTELARRGIKVSGTKAELIERLLESGRRYSLGNDNFVAPRVLPEDPKALPACYPDVYGDELEEGLLREQNGFKATEE